MLVDAHCHIDRYPDPSQMASKCESQKIKTVAVTQLPSHYSLAKQHLAGMNYVIPALGFHPLAVGIGKSELPLFLRLLASADYVGEVGLDFSGEGIGTKELQIEIFSTIIQAMAGSPKFMTIHSRGAADEVLEILVRYNCRNAVFHWFSGSLRSLDQAIDWGCWFSVNPSMVGTEKGRTIIKRIPKDRMLTETDGPYVKIGRRVAEPSDIQEVINYLARVWGKSPSDAEIQIEDNFNRAIGSPNDP